MAMTKKHQYNEKYIELIKDPKNKGYTLWKLVCRKHQQRIEAVKVAQNSRKRATKLTIEINALMQQYYDEVMTT